MKNFILFFLILTLKIYFSTGEHVCSSCLQMHVKLHFDLHSLIKLGHRKTNVFNMIAPLINKTEWYFRRPNMSLPLCIKVISYKYIWTVPALRRSEVEDVHLIDYCKWQETRASEIERSYSILLTGLRLFETKNSYVTGCVEGISYTNGHCYRPDACALLTFTKNIDQMANTLAHELAHSIGARHDEGVNNFIMSECTDRHKKPPTLWSQASRLHIEKFLRNEELAWCLGNHTLRDNIIRQHVQPDPENIGCNCKCNVQ